MDGLRAIFLLHVERLREESTPAQWLARWRVMLDHFVVQLYVVVLQSCSAHVRHLAGSLEDDAAGGTWACGLRRLTNSDLPGRLSGLESFPSFFFHEIEGNRSDVIAHALESLKGDPSPVWL